MCVDPAVELTRLPGQDVRITQRAGEQGAAFIDGEKIDSKVVCVVSAQQPELLLSPLDGDPHQLSCGDTGPIDPLVKL